MMTLSKKRQSKAGYTLLEIGLALGIIAMIFFAVVPASSGFLHERQIRLVGDEIKDLAARQRLQALTEGTLQTLIFDQGEVQAGEKSTSVPKGFHILVRKGGGDWAKPDKMALRFAPNGLVEVFSVRLERQRQWLEMDFDPLTALVAEERYSF